MRPLKLTIKGLNSFIEEQTIDFEKLTDRGLFGIFGPTGSGKSTILDGITLALYGDIARKSSNYINTNCNDLNVCFQFQISGANDRIFKVSRHFKRDKNTGNAKTHSASVVECLPTGEEVLAEGAMQVTKRCKEILGLSLEDFTRTVVLPQGKFSEFLKLEGRNRREMLERLFNLQEYGDELSTKLAREISKEKAHDNQLLGELKGYDEISEDKLKEGKSQLEVAQEKLKELEKKKQEIEDQYKESEEIWQLQKEMTGYHIRQKELEAKGAKIKDLEEKVRLGESALRIHPALVAFERTKQNIENEKKNLTLLEEGEKKLALEKNKLEEQFELVAREKDTKLPILKEKGSMLELIQEDDEMVIGIEAEVAKIEEGLCSVESRISALSRQRQLTQNTLDTCNQQILDLQKEEEGLRVDEKVRMQVQEGLMVSQRLELENSKMTKNLDTLNQLTSEMEQLQESMTSLKKECIKVEVLVKENEEKQASLKNPPYTQEVLMKKQEELVSLKEKWNRYQTLQKEISDYISKLSEDEKQEKALTKEIELQKQTLEDFKAQLEKQRADQLVITLQRHLHTGDNCPVCGGIIHELKPIREEQDETVKELEIGIEKQQKAYDELIREQSMLQADMKNNKEQLEKLEKENAPLKLIFEEVSVQHVEAELEACSNKMKDYEQQKQAVELILSKQREEKNRLEKEFSQRETALVEKQKQEATLKLELATSEKSIEEINKQLTELKKVLGDRDLDVISQEIQTKDKKRDEITKLLGKQTALKDKSVHEKEEVQGKLSKAKASLQRGLAQFDEKQKVKMTAMQRMGKRLKDILMLQVVELPNVVEIQNRLKAAINNNKELVEQLKGTRVYESVLGYLESESDENQNDEQLVTGRALENYPLIGQSLIELGKIVSRFEQELKAAIEAIDARYIAVQKQKEEIGRQYESLSKQLIEGKTKLEELGKRMQDEEQLALKGLREENMTAKEVKQYLLTKEIIEEFKHSINLYREECSKLLGTMEIANKKLAGRKIEETAWLKMQETLRGMTNEVAIQNEACINLLTYVKNMQIALEKLGKLRKEKEALDHKLAILSDLEKLFKGKRFVEYVASTRLKYISLEASKRLKEISCGNYGLEVDEDGRFVIRDYKNGGARRDASTLSGGETFLASLALALALSAEIQLKGTAPLELFFLDEGFGTLDDELLDTVMSSLERIHHDRLKIGIISHVEAIKNRVPVKLVLSPAEAGMGGTKLRLERS